MFIFLDNIVFSIQKSGGISVVWQSIIDALIASGFHDFNNIEYPGADENICRKNISLQNNEIRKSRLSFKIERYLNPKVKEDKPFIFHSSFYRTCSNKNAINVTTVHDFTYELYRSGFSKWLHCWQKYRAIRNSDVIVCITENTKRDVLKYLPDVDPKKVRVIYNGVSDNFRPLEIKKTKMDGKYVVFIGWRVDYKNFKLTVEALKGTEYKLAIVGAPLNEEEKAYLDISLGRENFKSFVRISDEELNQIYNSAYCLAYPSEYEGFGIPILEAQRAGCPVIAYNASSIPEVIGSTPLLLQTTKVGEFREKLEMIQDENIRKEIILEGLENSKRFSWRKMGEEYIQLYRELAQGCKP